MHLHDLPAKQIHPPKFALRIVNTLSVEYDELLTSVRDNGLLQPILVRQIAEDTYEVVEGNYRYTVCKQLGLSTIPCIIRELDDDEVLVFQIEANAIRPETKPVEYAEQLQYIMRSRPDMNVRRLSMLVHKSPAWVAKVMRLTSLHPGPRRELEKGNMGVVVATEIARLPQALQSTMYKQIMCMTKQEAASFVSSTMKDLKECTHRDMLHNMAMKGYKPVPFLQKMRHMRYEYETWEKAPVVLTLMKAKTPLEGWKAALSWVLNLDPESVEIQKRQLQKRLDDQEVNALKRKEDRRRLRKLREQSDS